MLEHPISAPHMSPASSRLTSSFAFRHLAACALLLGVLSEDSQAAVGAGVYNGTARTTVKYLNPTTLQVMATESYGRKMLVTVGARKQLGTTVESNPFFLKIAPTVRTTPPANGDVFTASARVVSGSFGTVLLQYWMLRNTATGFDGALVDNHSSDGAAKDRMIAKLGPNSGASYLLHDANIVSGLQCKVLGTTSGRQLNLTVNGYAYIPGQAIVQFSTAFTGRRP